MNLNFKNILTAGLFSWLFCFTAVSQQVSPFAGISYPGRGEYTTVRSNPKMDDYYSNPYGLALDSIGRVYFTDEHNLMLINGNNSLNRVGTPLDPSLNGGFQDGTATEGLFNSPQGVAVHPLTQDVYVCDFFNHSIRKIEKFLNTSSSQTMTTFSGAGPSSAGHVDGTLSNARFHNPSGIVIAKNGDMYISDRANHVIRKIAGNSVTTLAGSPGLTGKTDGNATSARFNLPEGLFLQGDSLLLIADFGNKSIRAINLATNEVTTVIGTGLNNPRSLTMAGNALFITDLYRILVYHDKQLSPYAGAETPDDINGFGLQARFGELMGITFYPNDSALLVVDEGYNVLKSVSIDKKYFTDNSNPDLQVPTILQASFSLYPNPAQTEIQLRSSFASNESLQIKLIDSKGTSLKEWKQSASYTNVLSIVELNAGLYFLKVNGEMGTSQVLRFIKE